MHVIRYMSNWKCIRVWMYINPNHVNLFDQYGIKWMIYTAIIILSQTWDYTCIIILNISLLNNIIVITKVLDRQQNIIYQQFLFHTQKMNKTLWRHSFKTTWHQKWNNHSGMIWIWIVKLFICQAIHYYNLITYVILRLPRTIFLDFHRFFKHIIHIKVCVINIDIHTSHIKL